MLTSSLLRGRARADARAAVADLSARLLALRPSRLPDITLSDGLAGVALAHAGLAAVFPRSEHRARARSLLQRAVDGIAREHLDPGLYLGLAGVGWVATQVLAPDDDAAFQRALFDAVDGALAAALASPWGARFDLVYGATGIGVHALERVHAPGARRLIDLVIDRLDAAAERDVDGLAWRSNPAWVSCAPREGRPAVGERGIGLAHGSTGMIALLARICAAEVSARTQARARRLLDDAVAWVLAQEAPTGFPYHAVPAAGARPRTRLAWCSGELGVAAGLLVAARATGQRRWEEVAVQVAHRAAARPVDEAGVVDIGLCHGATGVAHTFHRLALATGDERLAAAARAWFARALELRTPERGFAGFRALDPDRRHRPRWRSAPGFLTGGAGVALALAAACGPGAPGWDRPLMLP